MLFCSRVGITASSLVHALRTVGDVLSGGMASMVRQSRCWSWHGTREAPEVSKSDFNLDKNLG